MAKIRIIVRDYAVTLFSQGLILLGFILTFNIIGSRFGADGVGEFALVRRTISFLNTLLYFGLGIGLPRFLSLNEKREMRTGYLQAAGIVILGLTAITVLVMNVFSSASASLLFSNTSYATLVFPFTVLLIAYSFESLFYSSFQGFLMINTLNAMRLMNMALLPLIVVAVVPSGRISRIVLIIGIACLISSLVFGSYFSKDFFRRTERTIRKTSFKELLSYSTPRLPTELIYIGLLSLGPLIAVHFTEMKQVGFLSISQSLLFTVGAIFAPMSIILLPKISQFMKHGRMDLATSTADYIVELIQYVFLFASVQTYIFIDIIIQYWLGSDFREAIPIVRITFLSIPFYALFISMRSILDAVLVKPINLRNLIIAFGVFLGVSATFLSFIRILPPIVSLAVAFTIGMVVLGILTYLSVQRICHLSLAKNLKTLISAVIMNVAFGILSLLMKPYIGRSLIFLVGFAILVSILYIAVMWMSKVSWLRSIRKTVFDDTELFVKPIFEENAPR